MLENKNDNEVKEYVKKRNFDIKTIKRFGIGYANGTVPLYHYLIELVDNSKERSDGNSNWNWEKNN